MFLYNHLSPVILDDAMFFGYVPTCVNSGTSQQRDAAYLIAEQEMMQHLQTFLLPTRVTGSFTWNNIPEIYRLPYDYVIAIPQVVAKSLDCLCCCDLSDNPACAMIREGWGLIDVIVTSAFFCRCCGSAPGTFYQVEVTVDAGLPTGTAALDTSLHLALALAAQVALNEIVDPGANEGGPGDPGVQAHGMFGYSETRVPLQPSVFGQTPISNYIVRLVRHLKHRRPLKW